MFESRPDSTARTSVATKGVRVQNSGKTRFPIQSIAGHARFWNERLYSRHMLNTAGGDRMGHPEQGAANDGHLAELVRKAREERDEPSRGCMTGPGLTLGFRLTRT